MEGRANQDVAATPGLVMEQARSLVQTEEARFAAAQSRATTLLAVGGVIAGLGVGVLTGLDGRSFRLPIQIAGVEISIVLVLACVTGVVAIVSLLWFGTAAMGVLQEKPDPQPQKLVPVVKRQFPGMLGQGAAESTRVLLPLLVHQLEVVQAATEKVDNGLRLSARLLGIAVVAGLVLAVLILFGSTTQEQHVLSVERGESKFHLAGGSR